MQSVFNNHHRADAFQASDAPLLVVDTDLLIRDVNSAYLKATNRPYDELVEILIFDAFPDNPTDTEADGVTNLNASFERVFRSSARDYMPVQRYDIPSIQAPGAFVRKIWTPVNSPIHNEDGHLSGALHHVEDVTAVVDSIWDTGPSVSAGVNMDQHAWTSLINALVRETFGHRRASATAEQLQQALNSRVLIEQAKGVIAAREGISVDEAFTRLRGYARGKNVRLHEIAQTVIEFELSV
ncbi:MAG TPA: ANTAR domain-containing protein [Jiangellaceae bacterium]